MNDNLNDRIVHEAAAACRSFAAYQLRFFNSRAGWRGWENWLTVDVCRRLNHKHVLPFHLYPDRKKKRHLDFFVRGDQQVAVEIKVNFIDDDEVGSKIQLPNRILEDRDKLESLTPEIARLLIVSTCFDSDRGAQLYKSRLQAHLREAFQGWRASWHDCSVKGDGWNLLLVLGKAGRPAASNHWIKRTTAR
jgi:hypothetical protein